MTSPNEYSGKSVAKKLPRASPPKVPVGWSRDGVPMVPMYERGDIGGEFIRKRR